MPTDNTNSSAPPAAPASDPRDAKIATLEQQVKNLTEENEIIAKNADVKIDALKAELREAKKAKAAAAPAGDYCVLGGKTYEVAGTVSARFATDEGRKGHIGLDEDLVILKR